MPTRLRKLTDTGIWVLDFASLCLGAFLMAGIINVFIAGNRHSLPALEGLSPDKSTRTPIRHTVSNRAIVKRNLFGSALASPPPPVPEKPIRVALSPLRASLIGTVVAEDPAWSLGMIIDLSSSETGVYRIGDTLMAQATIVEVLG